MSDHPDTHLYYHEAMNTTYSIRLRSCDQVTAKHVARELFEELDGLEDKLSRYREGSDIARINLLKKGDTLYISEECHKCLMLAAQAFADTGGLFDITLGRSIQKLKDSGEADIANETGKLLLHPEIAAVTCQKEGRQIDLGGIGKGYALDHLKRLLSAWDIPSALLAAGNSTLLAIGEQSWPIALVTSAAEAHKTHPLQDGAISVSGDAIQGQHIIHASISHSSEDPQEPTAKVWVRHPSAALSDAYATACYLMDTTLLEEFASNNADVILIFP